MPHGVFEDLTGQMFGFLKVLEQTQPPATRKDKRQSYWKCECTFNNCGELTTVGRDALGRTTISCGCYHSHQLSIRLSLKNKKDAILSSAKEVWRKHYKNDGLQLNDFLILTQNPCEYCGLSAQLSNRFNCFTNSSKNHSKFAIENGWYHWNGLDRVDSSLGHTLENCVPCCLMCNKLKLELSLEDFLFKANNFNRLLVINILPIDTNAIISELFPYRTQNRKENRNFIMAKIKDVRSCGKRRGYDWSLTNHQAAQIFISPCAYCNKIAIPEQGIFNGADRVNNDLGYIFDNCVPCCLNCNAGKSDHTLKEFLTWINRIKDFQENKQVILTSQESIITIIQ